MKKVSIIALACLCAVSCSKGSGDPVPQDGRMTFSADAPGTRSYFPGTTGMMYWDSYDNLGAYAFDASNNLVASDFCAISTVSAGTNEATFNPKNVLYASSWFGANASSSAKYTFYAYYPQQTAPAATFADGGVLLSIPSAQTGEFGRFQICTSAAVEMTKEQVGKNKSVRFAFSPASSMLRLRLVIAPESQVAETYIKQLSVSVNGAALSGDCKLTFADGTLAATTTVTGRSVVTVNLPTPVRITRDAESNPYIDFVILPAAPSGEITFSAITLDNVRLTMEKKTVPGGGFAAGTRYHLDRSVSMMLDDNSPDGAYVDGGSAWEFEVNNDGAYTDGGFAW